MLSVASPRYLSVIAALACLTAAGHAQLLSDPAYTVVHNDAKGLQVRKELNGYGHYGELDGAADILYTGDAGSWTFDFSEIAPAVPLHSSGTYTIFLSLDDHALVDSSHYSIEVESDRKVELNKLLGGLAHGTERSGHFDTWVPIEVDLESFAGPHTLKITNTSSTGPTDWIGIDRIEASFTPVPEPAGLLALGGACIVLLGRRRR